VASVSFEAPGLQDLSFAIPREEFTFHDNGTTNVGFVIEASAGPAGVIIDQQRDYGRTMIARKVVAGEAVMELRVAKE
jgi:hypothetical protein